MPAPFNSGDFKAFLATGNGNAHAEVPKGLGRVANALAPSEDAAPKVAKTILKKTLAQHDKTYHPDGYKEGDECNFRAELMKGDNADDIKAVKPSKEERFGLVKFEETERGKKVTDIVDVTEVVKEQEEAEDSSAADRYLTLAGWGTPADAE